MLAHRGQRVDQMSVASPIGDVDRTFAPRVLEGAPSAETKELLCDGEGSAVPGSLVQRSVPGRSVWSRRVYPLAMLGQQLQHVRPIAALGGGGQCMPRLGRFGMDGLRLRDPVPNDGLHTQPLQLHV